MPKPSKEDKLNPLKSLTLGRTIDNKRSKKSYILSLRNVTLQPIISPFLNLKAEIDLRDFIKIGFCPEIKLKSDTAKSIYFLSRILLPIPIFYTTKIHFKFHGHETMDSIDFQSKKLFFWINPFALFFGKIYIHNLYAINFVSVYVHKIPPYRMKDLLPKPNKIKLIKHGF